MLFYSKKIKKMLISLYNKLKLKKEIQWHNLPTSKSKVRLKD